MLFNVMGLTVGVSQCIILISMWAAAVYIQMHVRAAYKF